MTATVADYLVKARELASVIANSLPTRIEAAALPLQSRIPFKALSLRELLFHRASALASPAVSLYESGNAVSGVVLTRAFMETVALMIELHDKLNSFLTNRDENGFETYLTKCLFANRYTDGGEMSEYFTKSILTPIDKFDKKVTGFRATYDTLSEYAHPNWSGLWGSFGNTDHENYVIDLGTRTKGKAYEIGIMTLASTLDILVFYYDEMPESLIALNRYFEAGWCENTE
jgi:hypothetical protein